MTMSGSVSSAASDLGSDRTWKRNQAAVTVATFIGFTGFTLVMPFLPLYLQQLGEHDIAAISVRSGLCLGITPLVTAMMTPAWARLAERTGKKLMVARSLLSFVVIMTAMAWVTHPWQVFALRLIQGFFAGYGPLAMMLAAESAPRDQMATAIGWVQTAQRLGPALGPVIGGLMVFYAGIRGSFYVSAVFYLFAFLLVLVGYKEMPRGEAEPAEVRRAPRTWRELRLVPTFVTAVAVIFALQMVDRSFGPVLPLYLGEVGIAAGRIPFLTGLIFAFAAAGAALGNQFTGRLIASAPVGPLVTGCAAIAAAGTLVFAFGSSVTVMLIASPIFGAAMGIATTAVYTDIGHRVESGGRAAAFGYLQTAYLLGLAVSPVVAGFIGAWSMRAVFVADAAGLASVAWLVREKMQTTGDAAAGAAALD
jgi:DHA1 family multidrug resistance protein-like MFS transporter